MAQTTMNIYASDQIFKYALAIHICKCISTNLLLHYSYVTRLGGTFIGLLFGLACWYIGETERIAAYLSPLDVYLL
jgi:hypothetical protein